MNSINGRFMEKGGVESDNLVLVWVVKQFSRRQGEKTCGIPLKKDHDAEVS